MLSFAVPADRLLVAAELSSDHAVLAACVVLRVVVFEAELAACSLSSARCTAMA